MKCKNCQKILFEEGDFSYSYYDSVGFCCIPCWFEYLEKRIKKLEMVKKK